MSAGRQVNTDGQIYGKVAVLMGGDSAERVISLETGRAVHEALRRKGVDAVALDARDGVIPALLRGKFDRVFIALHGRGGEDGVVQGMLETMGLPYTGSGVMGSALAMDKIRSKMIWQQMGLPTPAFMQVGCETDLETAVQQLGLPLMVKPVHEGSSCGASKLSRPGDISDAWRTADQFEDTVMAESWIEGTEYTAGLLGSDVLPLIRLETPRVFYDYTAKYEVDTTRYICPCGLTATEEERIQDIARQAFHGLDASGWGRVDLMMDEAGEVFLIEANTIPGMTGHSLVPMAAREAGLDFDELVLRILDSSLGDRIKMESATA